MLVSPLTTRSPASTLPHHLSLHRCALSSTPPTSIALLFSFITSTPGCSSYTQTHNSSFSKTNSVRISFRRSLHCRPRALLSAPLRHPLFNPPLFCPRRSLRRVLRRRVFALSTILTLSAFPGGGTYFNELIQQCARSQRCIVLLVGTRLYLQFSSIYNSQLIVPQLTALHCPQGRSQIVIEIALARI